jgi:hypothetical protein
VSGASAIRCSSLSDPSWTGAKAREVDMFESWGAAVQRQRKGGGGWWVSEGGKEARAENVGPGRRSF